ncbi:hypothetical protein Cgig2_018443 [Carnegiea gigantea]|uniref:F-box domain-containing protein n=1 Tax=Carnegiea gigantea TaxID=171969 RepID=A0A9Q1JI47_9CARY|nr:hypothetical protein Cgig2_018443 [Carnegiea gigantea]
MLTMLSTKKFWKVWGWFSSSSKSNWKSSRGEYVGEDGASNSTGDFDRIPDEILALIMKKLGPKETAKLCLVCKSWRDFVSSENRLWIYFFQCDPKEPNWESVFFAETHLRSGYPLQHVYDHMPPLSLMNIYALRAKVPGAVIVDGGSGYCKLGWSKYQDPSGRFATFLEFGNVEAPMYSRLRHFYGTIYNSQLGSHVGTSIMADNNRWEIRVVNYARVSIEIPIQQSIPFPKYIFFENEKGFLIHQEPILCDKCKNHGYSADNCRKKGGQWQWIRLLAYASHQEGGNGATQ